MTPTQRLANILNSVFYLKQPIHNINNYDYITLERTFIYRELMRQLDEDIMWLGQHNQARRAVAMCLIFMANSRIASVYHEIRDTYWQQWTQKFQPEMRDFTLFDDFKLHVGSIMNDMMLQVVTERRALQFVLTV